MSAVEVNAKQTNERDTLRTISFVLLALALVVSGYLSYVKATNLSMVCLDTGPINCDAVSSSIYAYFPRGTGIPVAFLGLATWLVVGVILLLESRVAFLGQYSPILLFGIAIFGFIFHSYLTYTSITFVGAICPWCLTAHALMTGLLVTQAIRVYRTMFAPH